MEREMQTKVNNVESAVCDFFNIDKKELGGQKKTAPVNLARQFVVYILHNECGLSVGFLAKKYNRCIRSIKYMSANMKGYLKYDKDIVRKMKQIGAMLEH